MQAVIGNDNCRESQRRSATRYTEDTVLNDPVKAVAETAEQNIPSMSLLDFVLNTLTDNKAEEIVSIDLRGKSTIADHMVVASGRSSRQVVAISEKLMEKLKTGMGVMAKMEGKNAGDWILVDAGDVIIHLFRPEVREFYQLEKMWATPLAEDTV